MVPIPSIFPFHSGMPAINVFRVAERVMVGNFTLSKGIVCVLSTLIIKRSLLHTTRTNLSDYYTESPQLSKSHPHVRNWPSFFPRLCAWGGCTIICCRFHIYPGVTRLGLVSFITVQCAYNRVHYGPMVLIVCLHITPPHYHHADVSESIGLLKKFHVHSVESVSKIVISSIIFRAICEAVWIQLTQFSCDDCENTCILSYYHHQIGSEPFAIVYG